MGTTVITRNYQVTIPSDVRERAGLAIGERLIVDVLPSDEIRIRRIKKGIIDKAFGILKIKETGLVYERRLRKEWAKRT